MHEPLELLHHAPQAQRKVIDASFYDAPQGMDFPIHCHSVWEIVYYRVGHIECPLGETLYDVQPGVVLAIPPGVMHGDYARTRYENTWILIDAPADVSWPLICIDDADQSLANVCRAFVHEATVRAANQNEMMAALLTQLDILLRRAHEIPGVSSADRLVQNIERLLDDRYATPLTIKEIAHDVGASPSYVHSQFARLRNQTPMAYLYAVRLQHALAMIRTSNLTLETIADRCGYSSAGHLSRHVKQATGHTPGELRAP